MMCLTVMPLGRSGVKPLERERLGKKVKVASVRMHMNEIWFDYPFAMWNNFCLHLAFHCTHCSRVRTASFAPEVRKSAGANGNGKIVLLTSSDSLLLIRLLSLWWALNSSQNLSETVSSIEWGLMTLAHQQSHFLTNTDAQTFADAHDDVTSFWTCTGISLPVRFLVPFAVLYRDSFTVLSYVMNEILNSHEFSQRNDSEASPNFHIAFAQFLPCNSLAQFHFLFFSFFDFIFSFWLTCIPPVCLRSIFVRFFPIFFYWFFVGRSVSKIHSICSQNTVFYPLSR